MRACDTPVLPDARRRLWLGGAGALAVAGGIGWLLRGRQAWTGPRPVTEAPPSEVCVVAPPLPYDPASDRPLRAARAVPVQARCPVCGMFPARQPRWAAQAIYRDGAVHFFDSPLSLHQFLHDVPRYAPGRQRGDIVALWATDFSSGAWTDATTAFHVHGAQSAIAAGPMRAGNLPAFASPAAAQQFADAHGGRVLPASAIDAGLLAGLGAPGRHAH